MKDKYTYFVENGINKRIIKDKSKPYSHTDFNNEYIIEDGVRVMKQKLSPEQIKILGEKKKVRDERAHRILSWLYNSNKENILKALEQIPTKYSESIKECKEKDNFSNIILTKDQVTFLINTCKSLLNPTEHDFNNTILFCSEVQPDKYVIWTDNKSDVPTNLTCIPKGIKQLITKLSNSRIYIEVIHCCATQKDDIYDDLP